MVVVVEMTTAVMVDLLLTCIVFYHFVGLLPLAPHLCLFTKLFSCKKNEYFRKQVAVARERFWGVRWKVGWWARGKMLEQGKRQMRGGCEMEVRR